VGGGARQGDVMRSEVKLAMKIVKKSIKNTFRQTIYWSPQEGDAKQLKSPTPSFLGRASRVTAKRQKNFGGKISKNSILSPFRVFSLSRSDVLFILRHI